MKQHQNYDKIFKENLEKMSILILSKIGHISLSNLENIVTHLPKTIERQADFLKIGTDILTQERKVFHVEFQTAIHPKMDKRELLYYALLYDKYELPIKQFVIYLGEGEWKTPIEIKHDSLTFKYEVICLNAIDYQLFINSEIPEEIILSILADFKKEDISTIIRTIIQRLQLKSESIGDFHKYITQLEILSNLRNLQPEIVKNLTTMPITFDITKDLRYQQGVEKGIEKGKEEGIQLGADKHTNQVIKTAFKKGMSAELIADILNISVQEVIERINSMGLM